MASRRFPWSLLPLLLLVACSKPQPTPSAVGGVGAAPQAANPAPAAPQPPPATTAPAYPAATMPTAAAASGPAETVLVSQDTNWPGIVAELLELRRRGTTLTVKLRLRNSAQKDQEPDILWPEAYLMDADNAKKYEVLKDEKGTYVAALAPNWQDRWHHQIDPGESYVVWAKFPAPPPEVKTVTLQINGMPPFEDLAIQDG